MGVDLTLRPGERGTKKLVEEYGRRLIAVRYRTDRSTDERLKTVELVVGRWRAKALAEEDYQRPPDSFELAAISYITLRAKRRSTTSVES